MSFKDVDVSSNSVAWSECVGKAWNGTHPASSQMIIIIINAAAFFYADCEFYGNPDEIKLLLLYKELMSLVSTVRVKVAACRPSLYTVMP